MTAVTSNRNPFQCTHSEIYIIQKIKTIRHINAHGGELPSCDAIVLHPAATNPQPLNSVPASQTELSHFRRLFKCKFFMSNEMRSNVSWIFWLWLCFGRRLHKTNCLPYPSAY